MINVGLDKTLMAVAITFEVELNVLEAEQEDYLKELGYDI